MRISILGVPIDAVTRTEARAAVERMLVEPVGHLVTTPNAEMLVAAHRDPAFRAALGTAALSLTDGSGPQYAALLRGQRIPERIPGTDFVDDLAAIAAAGNHTMFLLGGRGDVAARAADVLRAAHPGLVIVGAESGGDVTHAADGTPSIDPIVEDRIVAAAPAILLVAFGHGTQERWIADRLAARALPSVRIAIGIGGAFDFYAGTVRRAPAWMRALGIEWLWRLILQPWRIRRVWTAVVTFPLLALRNRS